MAETSGMHLLIYLDSLLTGDGQERNFFTNSQMVKKDPPDEPPPASVGLDSIDTRLAILKKISALSHPKDPNKENAKKAANFFTPYIEGNTNWKLARIYTVLRKTLREDLNKAASIHANQFAEQIGTLMVLAYLLEHIPDDDPDVIQVKASYHADLSVYKQLLQDMGVDLSKIDNIDWGSKPVSPAYSSQFVRDNIPAINPGRLLLQRLRRTLLLLQALLKQYDDYHRVLSQIENHGSFFFFSNLAWVFFIPRLLTNVALILKHSLIPSTSIEEELSLKTRFLSQIVKRWDELFNDCGWLASGITTCFFLAGKAPVIGAYLAVAMQAWDLMVTSLRLYVEMSRLYDIKVKYKELNSLNDDDPFLLELELRMTFELKVHAWNVVNFCLLLVFACLMATATNPIVPVIAATLAVLLTIIHYGMTQWATQHRRQNWGLNGPDAALVSSCIIQMSELPGDVDEMQLGVFSRAYIRVINPDKGLNALYYVNKNATAKKQWTDYLGMTTLVPAEKKINLVEKFSLDASLLEKFDGIVVGHSAKPKTITKKQLEQIGQIGDGRCFALSRFDETEFQQIKKWLGQSTLIPRDKLHDIPDYKKVPFNTEEIRALRQLFEDKQALDFRDKMTESEVGKLSDLEVKALTKGNYLPGLFNFKSNSKTLSDQSNIGLHN